MNDVFSIGERRSGLLILIFDMYVFNIPPIKDSNALAAIAIHI